MAVTAAMVAAVSWVAPKALAGDDSAATPSFRDQVRRYVVQPGDTLWGIASRVVGPEGDPRAVVDRIAEASGSGALLQPGQVLSIPLG